MVPDSGPPATPAVGTTTTPAAAPVLLPPADIYEVTPDGLTTAVNVPATVSGAEFDQGCAEAKDAIATYGSADVVLALMQATPEDSGEGVTVESVDDPWAGQSAEEQANLIAVVEAAAAGEC